VRKQKEVKLVKDKAYIIRRPGTTRLEVAIWHNGWRTVVGHIASGGALEVWDITDYTNPSSGLNSGSPGCSCLNYVTDYI
jgi:hypothetical protein